MSATNQLHQHPIITFSNPVGMITSANPRFAGPLAGNQEALKAEILKLGGRIEETNGKYGEKEPSLVVHNLPVHHLLALGKAAGQESVIHSENGHRKMIYTNGDNEGKYHPGKPEYQVWDEDAPDLPDDYYTHFPGRGYLRLHFDFNQLHPHENANMAKSSHNLLLQGLKKASQMANKRGDLHKHLHKLHQGLEKAVLDFEEKCVAMRKSEMGKVEAVGAAPIPGGLAMAEKPTLCKLCDSDMKKCHCDKLEGFAKGEPNPKKEVGGKQIKLTATPDKASFDKVKEAVKPVKKFEIGKELTGSMSPHAGAPTSSPPKTPNVQTMVERVASRIPGRHLFGQKMEKGWRAGTPDPGAMGGGAPSPMPKRPGKITLPGAKPDVKLTPSAGPGKLPTVAKKDGIPSAPKPPGASAGDLPKLPGTSGAKQSAKPPAMGAGSAQAGKVVKGGLEKGYSGMGIVPSGGNTPSALGNTSGAAPTGYSNAAGGGIVQPGAAGVGGGSSPQGGAGLAPAAPMSGGLIGGAGKV